MTLKIRVAARGSRLSLAQVNLFVAALLRRFPDAEVVVKTVKTTGDIYRDLPFTEIGAKGIFEREVNKAVIDGKADVAVHSLKDVPSKVSEALTLAAVLPRDPPYDVLVSRESSRGLQDLPPGAVVGTSSARRRAMILHLRPDIQVKPLRGNVDTRLRKLREGLYDAIVLAEAGLVRLGLKVDYIRLPPEKVVPAPAQGIIAVYARRSDQKLLEALAEISDSRTMVEARAERAFLASVGGGCHVPLGGYAELTGGRLVMRAGLASPGGERMVYVVEEGDPERPEELGERVARILRERGRGLL